MPIKELVLVCAGGIKGVLDVQEKDTLADVRIQIDEELDDDLIVSDFAFHVDDVRISQKQERKKLAWLVLDKRVSIQAKRSRPLDLDDATIIISPSAKKLKVAYCDNATQEITPQSSLRGRGGDANNERSETPGDSDAANRNPGSNMLAEADTTMQSNPKRLKDLFDQAILDARSKVQNSSDKDSGAEAGAGDDIVESASPSEGIIDPNPGPVSNGTDSTSTAKKADVAIEGKTTDQGDDAGDDIIKSAEAKIDSTPESESKETDSTSACADKADVEMESKKTDQDDDNATTHNLVTAFVRENAESTLWWPAIVGDSYSEVIQSFGPGDNQEKAKFTTGWFNDKSFMSCTKLARLVNHRMHPSKIMHLCIVEGMESILIKDFYEHMGAQTGDAMWNSLAGNKQAESEKESEESEVKSGNNAVAVEKGEPSLFGSVAAKPLFGSGAAKPLFGSVAAKPLFRSAAAKPVFGSSSIQFEGTAAPASTPFGGSASKIPSAPGSSSTPFGSTANNAPIPGTLSALGSISTSTFGNASTLLKESGQNDADDTTTPALNMDVDFGGDPDDDVGSPSTLLKESGHNDVDDTVNPARNMDVDFGGGFHDDNDDESDAGTVDLIDLNEDCDDTLPSAVTVPIKPNARTVDEGNPNDEAESAVEISRSVLTSTKSILEENLEFCSIDRRNEWTKEIEGILAKSSPKTTVGVLGNTGVGKSSLLNALLDEASVLPTSGSRGCTAAVVELRFNTDLEEVPDGAVEVPVYRGEVEFMTRQEWVDELKILVDECSTQEKTVYAREPDPQSAAEAAAAWAKIDQVYGKGTMRLNQGQMTDRVFNRLAGDFRIIQILTPRLGSGHRYNTIPVKEGSVVPGSPNAKVLVSSYESMNAKMRRSKKKWAHEFRSKINSFVYRKGNGDQPQTWPLIRKVVLHGPWACLSTGACLVDLPGVRDANAARARVAEQYLQHCNQIWVVAPIKRAVDDGTAKELLGEQFKRRLLMDGQYGNVSFICTQTDDCEATEIMRDHADVAQKVPGRWEKMTEISDEICRLEFVCSKLLQAQDDLNDELNDAIDDEVGADDCLKKLADWNEEHFSSINQMQAECEVKQRQLKTLCAIVRNEYSTKCLQTDFRAGLKDLYRRSDDEDGDGSQQEQTEVALPDDFNMDVYCISSNDYLKVQGIKPKSDGAPNTFSEASDTQIPNLRSFVHDITARHRSAFAKNFVHSASDMLDRVKLLAINAANVPSGRSSLRCMRLFDNEVNKISDSLEPLADDFKKKMSTKIESSLEPVLVTGAKKGIQAALPIVESWGSKSRRTRHHRDKTHNGLYWATYQATVRREGVFTSGSAGPIDMNQEICDPMEREFSVDWQRTLDSALRVHLSEAETKVQGICLTINKTIATEFEQEGVDKNQLINMSTTANRSCANVVKASFAAMRHLGTETQRNLNRSLLPLVTENMRGSYSACLTCPRGSGAFNRMKFAMQSMTENKVQGMFENSKVSLLKGIEGLLKQLVSLISQSSLTITKHLEDVYSIYWDDQNDLSKALNSEMQERIRKCRDALLPDLNQLGAVLGNAQALVGIERTELDLDVMAVESLDNTVKRIINTARDKGEIIDLCDSDEEIEDIIAKLPKAKPFVRIKADPGTIDSDLTVDM